MLFKDSLQFYRHINYKHWRSTEDSSMLYMREWPRLRLLVLLNIYPLSNPMVYGPPKIWWGCYHRHHWLWYLVEHPSFQDHGMSTKPIWYKWKGSCEKEQEFNSSLCNFKLVGAKYFNKGLLNSNKTLKISMNSTRDSTRHGTCVSTIIVGNYVNKVSFLGYGHGTASSVAPRAMPATYKVVWDLWK